MSEINKKLTVLGSTGSIGKQALDVASRLNCPIMALAAHSNAQLLEQQVRKFKPKLAVLYDEKAANELRIRTKDLSIRVSAGMDGLCEAASLDTDIVVNSVVGMVGLKPTITALKSGNHVALANKETLVAGGALVMDTAKSMGVNIIPVDSEHSAIFQCLQGAPPDKKIKRLILTASGGPFFGKTSTQLKAVTPKQALKHPNWSMGSKITIDSATMMNKGLELIEACWLFGVSAENIDIVIHRESIVHSLVEYQDNSVIAQLGVPDMHIPIQYAITWPDRVCSQVKRLDLSELGSLSFFKPDYETFSCINACRIAMERGGLAACAVNAANEMAVSLFLSGKIKFLDINSLVLAAFDYNLPVLDQSIEQIIETDNAVRQMTLTAAQNL